MFQYKRSRGIVILLGDLGTLLTKGLVFVLTQVRFRYLSERGFLRSKPTEIPTKQGHHLGLTEGNLVKDGVIDRRLVGGLIYRTIMWPKMSYTMHILSQFS